MIPALFMDIIFILLELSALNFLCYRFALHKLQQVFAPAGLRIRTAHIKSAERVNADQGARAFTVQIEIADVKFTPRPLEIFLAGRKNRAGQTEFRIVGDLERVVEIPRLDHGQDWRKDLFLFESGPGRDVVDDRRLDIKTFRIVALAARNDLAALVDALFDIAESVVERLLLITAATFVSPSVGLGRSLIFRSARRSFPSTRRALFHRR